MHAQPPCRPGVKEGRQKLAWGGVGVGAGNPPCAGMYADVVGSGDGRRNSKVLQERFRSKTFLDEFRRSADITSKEREGLC